MPRLITSGQPLTEALIAAARAHWGLGDAQITLVAARENHVYRVDLPTGTAALRLHRRGYRSLAELNSELAWMDMLAKAGIAVPAPIAAYDRSQLLMHDGIIIDMLTWINGHPLGEVDATEAIYFDLGRLMAQMHALADRWTPPTGFERPEWDTVGDTPTWGRFWENPLLTDTQRTKLTRFRSNAQHALAQLHAPDIGLIHADLMPDNVMLEGDTLFPIDFDDGGFGHRLFDVATVTFRSRRTDPTGALAEATIAGYQSLRGLDTASLPLFEALRACTYVGWNISRMDEDPTRNARFITAAEQSIARLKL